MDASAPPVAPHPGRPARAPLSLARVDTAISRSAAGVGFAFFVQSAPVLIGQADGSQPIWTASVVALVVAALLWARKCCAPVGVTVMVQNPSSRCRSALERMGLIAAEHGGSRRIRWSW